MAEELPPACASSSIMAMVLNREGQILYLIPPDLKGGIANLMPGGRPEGNEPPDETVIREVAEETGWRVKPVQMVGFRHFFHTEPRSPRTDRPYPDFIQPIYVAVAESFDPKAILPGDRILAEFMDYEEVEARIVEGQDLSEGRQSCGWISKSVTSLVTLLLTRKTRRRTGGFLVKSEWR